MSFTENVTAVAGIPANDLLVGTPAGDNLDHAALYTVNRTLKNVVTVEDGGQLGQTMEGLAVYHANNAGGSDGGAGDWALVSTDGRLLLYEVTPTFGFITESSSTARIPVPTTRESRSAIWRSARMTRAWWWCSTPTTRRPARDSSCSSAGTTS